MTLSGRVEDIIAEISAAIRAQDRARRAERRWGGMACASGIGIVAGVVLWQVGWTAIGLSLAGLSILVALLAGAVSAAGSAPPLDVGRAKMAHRFLSVLREDIPRKAKCSVTLRSGRLKRVGRKQSGKGVKEERRGLCFEANGTLTDGLAFRLRIERREQVKISHKHGKRNPRQRGTRTVERIVLMLWPDANTFPDLAAATRIPTDALAEALKGVELGAVMLPEEQPGALSLTARVPGRATHSHLLGVMAALYGCMTAGKKSEGT